MWLNSHAINLMNQQRSSGRTPLTPNGLIPNQEGWYVFVSLAAMRKAERRAACACFLLELTSLFLSSCPCARAKNERQP